jgi:hypothetical protein
MRKALLAGAVLILAGCAQIPPSPQEIADKKFEPVPGKAVVYVVQGAVGPALAVGIEFDDGKQITTWTGTFYRWVTTPGTHLIQNTGAENASITVQVEAGKIYFVEQFVTGWRGDVTNSRLELLDDNTGRMMVGESSLCCGVN